MPPQIDDAVWQSLSASALPACSPIFHTLGPVSFGSDRRAVFVLPTLSVLFELIPSRCSCECAVQIDLPSAAECTVADSVSKWPCKTSTWSVF